MAVFRTLPRRRYRRSWCVGLLIAAYVMWCELASIYVQSWFWRVPVTHSVDTVRCLLIATRSSSATETSRVGWARSRRADADRYIRRAFARALAVTAPSYVIFLGDLFVSSDVQTQASSSQCAL